MYIQGYQIKNVLNVYRKQLSEQRKTADGHNGDADRPSRAGSAPGDQRQTIFNMVSSEILSRLQNYNPSAPATNGQQQGHPDKAATETVDEPPKESIFTYTTIDEHNRKVINSLPAATPGTLIRQVEQRARQLMDSNEAKEVNTRS